MPITGTLIGESLGLPGPPSQAYRADITGLGLVSPGVNSLTVEGMDFTFHNAGAGIVVIFDDGSGTSEIEIRDGHDFAAANQGFSDPLDRCVPQAFTFSAAESERLAKVDLFIGDGEADRADAVEITVGMDTSIYPDLAISADGAEWDTISLDVLIPAGETTMIVEVISATDGGPALPDSITWIGAVATVPGVPDGPMACRVTGGGVDSFGNWNNRLASGVCSEDAGANYYTFGGQAGAPTASQPQPYGEWTHHQRRGIDGSFVFHAGTSSAPDGTEISMIVCSDPEWCDPARSSPAKQIDFEGVGTFKNIKKPSALLSEVIDGETYHWFEVHIEDLGEPGKGGKQDPPAEDCPAEGSSGGLANCDCPDFYKIVIYDGFDPGSESPNMTDVIYEVYGYVTGGNLQIHPPVQ
jgi:hypothetical protein